VTEAASSGGATRSPRVLLAAPRAFVHPSTGEPAFGSYTGPLPPVELGRLGLAARVAKRKRWVYASLTTDELWISLAIVRTGYAATAFAFAYDLVGKRMLVDGSVLGPAFAARVASDAHAQGELARFALGKTRVVLTRRGTTLDVTLRMRDLVVDASMDEATGPPAITAIAPVGAPGEGLLNATEKRALLAVRGRAECAGRARSLDGGLGGYDYTHGLLARHTMWRWGFGLGRAEGGERFGFNVVQGFVGEAECAAFLGDEVVPLAEPRFHFDVASPDGPWRLEGDGLDLAFKPGAMHQENTQLVLIRSRFVQPVGTFSGTVRVGERDVRVEGLPGVVEDQDVLW
jgi:hypothetical protein